MYFDGLVFNLLIYKHFKLSILLVWWSTYTSISIFNCLFWWFGGQTTHLLTFLTVYFDGLVVNLSIYKHLKLSILLLWWSTYWSINIFNCLFWWFGGQPTHLLTFLTVYFDGLVINRQVYKHFKLSILLLWWSTCSSINFFNCLFSWFGGQPTHL